MNISVNTTCFVAAFLDGIDIVVHGEEYFLSYSDFPWFEYCNVFELNDISADRWGVYWKSVDIDLSMDSLKNPNQYPEKISVEAWLRARKRNAARMLGAVCSAKKTASSRENGMKGGRPRRTAVASV